MATPKERLQEAAHKLAGSAEAIEDLLCPARPTLSDPYGIRHDQSPMSAGENSDTIRERVAEGLKSVRQFADEIEGITK